MDRRRAGSLVLAGTLAITLPITLGACHKVPPPPPHVAFADLPVSGSLADARFAGFTDCQPDTISMRCRRAAVTVMGAGPFRGAVELAGGDGRGGFRELVLWHDRDQNAVQAVPAALRAAGWATCYTGAGARGDQLILARPGAPIWFSMDLSYWGKRRLRILPAWRWQKPDCESTGGAAPLPRPADPPHAREEPAR